MPPILKKLQQALTPYDLMRAKIVGLQASREELSASDIQRTIESLTILPEDGEATSLILRPEQEVLWHAILDSWERRDGKAWLIILKSRRLGMSTFILALYFSLCHLIPGQRAFVAAHIQKSTDALFGMVRSFYQYLPPEEQRRKPLSGNTRQQLEWAFPHKSAFIVATANSTNMGSGDRINYLHCSEVAKWEDPVDPMNSVVQCVPKTGRRINIWESTAFGAHNLFHHEWDAAEEGESEYEPVFLTWVGEKRYSIPDPAPVIKQLTDDGKKFQKDYNISDEQMAWVHTEWKGSCRRDWKVFNQEYPATARLAFAVSGYRWFPGESMDSMQTAVKKPLARVRFIFRSDIDPYVGFEEEEFGAWLIWEFPIAGEHYVVGMDVGEGVGAAHTVIDVFKVPRTSGGPIRMVAHFNSNNLGASEAGVEVFKIGHYYNRAFLGVEGNNHGGQVLGVLLNGHGQVPQTKGGYPNLYYKIVPARRHEEETQKAGWWTDKNTRPLLFNRFRELVESKLVEIPLARTLIEMEGIMWDPMSQTWVQSRRDPETKIPLDDEVFAAGIGLQMIDHWQGARALPPAKQGRV